MRQEAYKQYLYAQKLGQKYYSDFLLREAKVLEILQEYLKKQVAKK